MPVRLLGAVLAGGHSLRFGRDKAVEEIAGLSLVERAVRSVREATDHVVAIADRVLPVAPCIPDLRPGGGPLAGLETALGAARDRGLDGVLVLACDMPLVRVHTLKSLSDAVVAGAPAAVAVRDGSGGTQGVRPFEPLCAAYATALLPVASALLDEGVRAAGALFERAGGERVVVAATELLNVNTRRDAAVAAAALARTAR